MSPLPIMPFGARPVVCIAGGPSLTLAQVRYVAMARCRDLCNVIAVNDAGYLCWFADILHASDERWWLKHRGMPGFRGLKTAAEITGFHDVRSLKKTGDDGFDETPGCIRTGSNGGYQAVHLAAQLGAKDIILVAFDFTPDGALEHWFGRHGLAPNGGTMDLRSNIRVWLEQFRTLTDALKVRGVKVRNASLQSTISWLEGYDVRHLVEN